jgi:hypothetical protein
VRIVAVIADERSMTALARQWQTRLMPRLDVVLVETVDDTSEQRSAR